MLKASRSLKHMQLINSKLTRSIETWDKSIKFKKFIIRDHYEFDKKVVNSKNPVIVNFHAEWCEPCKILTPKLIEMLELDETVDLAIIDVDENLDLVHTFEVKAVPAVLGFKNGVVVDKFIGLVDSDMIDKLIVTLKPSKK